MCSLCKRHGGHNLRLHRFTLPHTRDAERVTLRENVKRQSQYVLPGHGRGLLMDPVTGSVGYAAKRPHIPVPIQEPRGIGGEPWHTLKGLQGDGPGPPTKGTDLFVDRPLCEGLRPRPWRDKFLIVDGRCHDRMERPSLRSLQSRGQIRGRCSNSTHVHAVMDLQEVTL